MLVFSKFFRIYPLAIFAIFLFQIGVKMAPSQVPQRAESSSAAQPISVFIRTDHEKYSTSDTVKLDVSLQNTSDATVYVDRRMFWGCLLYTSIPFWKSGTFLAASWGSWRPNPSLRPAYGPCEPPVGSSWTGSG